VTSCAPLSPSVSGFVLGSGHIAIDSVCVDTRPVTTE
jgi:hypothetical protein